MRVIWKPYKQKFGDYIMYLETNRICWREYLSPLKLILLSVNALCFGGCLVLLALGSAGGPMVLLTVGTGLSLFGGLTGALIATRRANKEAEQSYDEKGTVS